MEEENISPLIRLKRVLELIPVGKSSWWNGVKSGLYPQPVYIGPRSPAWRLTDIAHLAEHGVRQRQ